MASNNGLTFKFSADTDGARRAIANMASSAGRNLTVLAGSAVLASRNVEAISDAAKRARGGVQDFGQWVKDHRANIGRVVTAYSAWGIGVHGVIAATAALVIAVSAGNKVLREMQEIIEGADAAGVSTSFFQTFTRQATALQLKVEDLAAALKRAKEQTDLSVGADGTRVISEPVKILRNIEAEVPQVGAFADIVNNSYDAEKRIIAILNAIVEIQKTAQKIGSDDLRLWAEQLAKVSFGEKGREIAEALARGNMELAKIKAGVSEAGKIFDSELLKRTKEVQGELNSANAHLRDEMIPFMQKLGSLAVDFKAGWAGIVSVIASAIGAVNKLNEKLETAVKLIAPLAPFTNIFAQVPKVGELGSKVSNYLSPRKEQPDPKSVAAARTKRRVTFNNLGEVADIPAKAGSKAGGNKDTATPTAVDRYIQNAEKAIRLLEAEAAALGRTRQERQIALDLARAENAAKERGAPLNERELAQIKQLAARRAQLTEQIRRQKEAEEAVKQASHFLGRQALDALTDIIVEGQKAEDVLKRLAIAFANAALQASLFGTGPFAKLGLFGGAGEGGLFGLLGKGFAGLFATGGHIPAGQWGIAGEKGPEIITGPANVIPAIRAGAMGTPSFVIHNYGEAGLVSVRQVGDMMDIRVAEAFRYTDMQVAGSERMTMARVSEQRARSAT